MAQEGTQIGADGRRYPRGSLPELTENDVTGTRLRVQGEPAEGDTVLFIDGEIVWGTSQGEEEPPEEEPEGEAPEGAILFYPMDDEDGSSAAEILEGANFTGGDFTSVAGIAPGSSGALFSPSSPSALTDFIPAMVGATAFTVEAWISIPDEFASSALFALRMDGGLGYESSVDVNGSETPELHGVITVGNSLDVMTQEPVITPGEVYHIAYTRLFSTGENILYVDGVEVASSVGAFVGQAPLTSLKLVGHTLATVDSLAIYDEVLSPETIAEHAGI